MLIGSGELDTTAPIVRHIHVGDGYDTVVDWGGLGRLPQYLTQLKLPSRIFLFTDSNLQDLYATTLLQNLVQSGFEPYLYVVPAGEASKSLTQLGAIYDWLLEQQAERREAIVALGGGVTEIVKYGIILDTELFAQLEAYADVLRTFSHSPIALLCQIIARCIDLKAMIIEEDEREQGRRAILNYGHTIAHALENVSGYGEWLHGEAVSLGMVAAGTLAQEAGMFPASDLGRQNALLAALGLPIVYHGSVRAQDILAKIQLDKKVVGKRVRWIMPQRIGEVVVTPMTDELVERVVTAFFADFSTLRRVKRIIRDHPAPRAL